ncbi:hypothetical protein LINPERHAP1_LOCUS20749 [Linum perenne]
MLLFGRPPSSWGSIGVAEKGYLQWLSNE